MIGLLWKDLFNLKGQIKVYLCFPIFFIGLDYMQHSLAYMPMMVVMIGVFLPISAFAYDEMVNFDAYALTLPLTRKDLIHGKYLLAMLCSGVISLISLLLSFMLIAISGLEELQVSSYTEVSTSLLLVLMATLMMVSFIIPLEYKYGSEKARIAIVVLFAGVGGSMYLLNMLSSIFDSTRMIAIFEANPVFIMGILCIVTMMISYALSLWIIKKKQY